MVAKDSITTLLGERAGAQELLAKSRRREHEIGLTRQDLASGAERLDREIYDRIWAGESTGNAVDDIVIAIKGAPDMHVAEKFRSLMGRFAVHKGQFVAGRHKVRESFDQVLVGIISSDMPMFCWSKKEILLPLSLAVSFDSNWQWGFEHIHPAAWTIEINKEETGANRRCYFLERLWEKNEIHIGDEAVLDFLMKTVRHKYGPVVTLTRVASALGRPVSTVLTLGKHMSPFLGDMRGCLPEMIEARNALTRINERTGWISKEDIANEFCDKIKGNLADVVKIIEVVETTLRHAEHPHILTEK